MNPTYEKNELQISYLKSLISLKTKQKNEIQDEIKSIQNKIERLNNLNSSQMEMFPID